MFGGVLPHRRILYPAPRRHRLHLGALASSRRLPVRGSRLT
jgi:hypothetical protein